MLHGSALDFGGVVVNSDEGELENVDAIDFLWLNHFVQNHLGLDSF